MKKTEPTNVIVAICATKEEASQKIKSEIKTKESEGWKRVGPILYEESNIEGDPIHYAFVKAYRKSS